MSVFRVQPHFPVLCSSYLYRFLMLLKLLKKATKWIGWVLFRDDEKLKMLNLKDIYFRAWPPKFCNKNHSVSPLGFFFPPLFLSFGPNNSFSHPWKLDKSVQLRSPMANHHRLYWARRVQCSCREPSTSWRKGPTAGWVFSTPTYYVYTFQKTNMIMENHHFI